MKVTEASTKVKTVVDEEIRAGNLESQEYLGSYKRQLEDAKGTYTWVKPKLGATERREWERTIEALGVVVQALEVGFDPIIPPRNWASGSLHQYIAPIPGKVRESIDKAESIFGLNRILIYDPNTEHFSRPKKFDPLAVGFVDLADQRLHFLVGAWDIASDLKFIKGAKRLASAGQEVGRVITAVNRSWEENFRIAKEKAWDKKTLQKKGVIHQVLPYQIGYTKAPPATTAQPTSEFKQAMYTSNPAHMIPTKWSAKMGLNHQWESW